MPDTPPSTVSADTSDTAGSSMPSNNLFGNNLFGNNLHGNNLSSSKISSSKISSSQEFSRGAHLNGAVDKNAVEKKPSGKGAPGSDSTDPQSGDDADAAMADELPNGKIVVCAEKLAATSRVIPHAVTLSKVLDVELLLVHVIEPQSSGYTPLDPFEWDLRRREAEAFVAQLSKDYASEGTHIATRVMQGRSSDQICACVFNNANDIAALCRSDVEQPGHIGHTARRVLEMAASSILMIPASTGIDDVPGVLDATLDTLTDRAQDEHQGAKYKRVLVPLDGSARAECALPFARKIARGTGAEIVLVHAIPEASLTEVGPLESEDVALKDQIARRNERVAREYLERIGEQMRIDSLTVSTSILTGGDARRLLNGSIVTEAADLLVISSHGLSGHTDVPTGDVAHYILSHSKAPVLMIRRPFTNPAGHVYRQADSKGVRRPIGAT